MKAYQRFAAFACCLTAVALTAVALAAVPPQAQQPQEDRQARLRKPNAAYRTAEIDPAFVTKGVGLATSPVPGMISFAVNAEAWTGRNKKDMTLTGGNVARLRIEVYDPKDPQCEAPIFIKNGPVRDVRGNPGQDFLARWREEFHLGPFPGSEDPYTVKIMVLDGLADPEKKADPDHCTTCMTRMVYVN